MMADGFNALLDSLHLDSCYVIGWSDGGIDGLQQGSADLRKQPQTPEIKNRLKIADLDLYQPNMTFEQLHRIKCPTLVIS